MSDFRKTFEKEPPFDKMDDIFVRFLEEITNDVDNANQLNY